MKIKRNNKKINNNDAHLHCCMPSGGLLFLLCFKQGYEEAIVCDYFPFLIIISVVFLASNGCCCHLQLMKQRVSELVEVRMRVNSPDRLKSDDGPKKSRREKSR